MGTTMKVDEATIKTATKENTRVNFDADGETFSKAALTFPESSMVQIPVSHHIPGVTLIQELSDPIHGSLGEPAVKSTDLTPEQQFEQSQRAKKPVVFKDDKDQVVDTANSIKTAEELTGGSMPEPTDPDQVKKTKPTPKYHLADSDDEDEDTVETRKSVKTIEKRDKHRFFINAKE